MMRDAHVDGAHEGWKLTRRDWLKTVAAGIGAAPLAGCGGINALGGRNTAAPVTLRLRYEMMTVGGLEAMVRTYGTIPGPVLRVRPGQSLPLTFINDLPPGEAGESDDDDGHVMRVGRADDFNGGENMTNLHTHGFQCSPSDNADNVLLHIMPGETFEYLFPLPADHPPGVAIYHPHIHGSSAVQVLSGMAGAIVIEGGLDEVPEIAAAEDKVLVFQEIRLGADHRVADFLDAVASLNPITFHTVNGEVEPTYAMAPGEVQRWRFVCTTSRDYLRLTLDGHPFHVLAWDGITLPAPLQTNELLMTPGNRVEVLIKGGDPGSYALRANPYNIGFGGILETKVLANLQIGGGAMNMALPSSLPVPARQRPIPDSEISGHQTVEFGLTTTYVINGLTFDPERVDFRVRVGTAEEWTLLNTTPEDHPFHIHINPFLVLEVNGDAVAPRWMDTVIVPRNGGTVKIRHRFLEFPGRYPVHCHMLPHEDMGMMALVEAT